jgi:hypothetical protein
VWKLYFRILLHCSFSKHHFSHPALNSLLCLDRKRSRVLLRLQLATASLWQTLATVEQLFTIGLFISPCKNKPWGKPQSALVKLFKPKSNSGLTWKMSKVWPIMRFLWLGDAKFGQTFNFSWKLGQTRVQLDCLTASFWPAGLQNSKKTHSWNTDGKRIGFLDWSFETRNWFSNLHTHTQWDERKRMFYRPEHVTIKSISEIYLILWKRVTNGGHIDSLSDWKICVPRARVWFCCFIGTQMSGCECVVGHCS